MQQRMTPTASCDPSRPCAPRTPSPCVVACPVHESVSQCPSSLYHTALPLLTHIITTNNNKTPQSIRPKTKATPQSIRSRFSLACCAPQSTPRHDDEISCRLPDPCDDRLCRMRYGAELTRLPLTSHLLLVCQGDGTRTTKERELNV
jgi:hypothetical protein